MTKTAADRLTLLALIVALAIVFARGTILEAVRPAGGSGPDPQTAPAGPGAPTGLTLDLIAALPALLLLARRVARPDESARSSLACILAAAVAAWVAASALWADDKFAAVVQAAHLAAAFSLLWAASQCVTTPRRAKLIAAAAFGFLLLQIINAIQWRFVEMPATLRLFQQHKPEILAANGWKPGDFLARQYEAKLKSREMLGFTSSSNSFAAVLVMLMGVSTGLIIQKFADRRRAAAAALTLGLAAGIWILCYTQSKAALVTPILTAILLLLTWRLANFAAARPTASYFTVAAVILAAIAAVIAYGLRAHTLPGASLNFRWRYWVASWRLFLDHPLLGVGWNNFAAHYLHYRLPEAAEEILDPHDFLIRFLTETGLIGALLATAWIARLWWELTRGPHATASMSDSADIRTLAWAILAGLALTLLAGIDFQQSWDFVFTQLCNDAMLFGALLVGAWAASLNLDGRPAPWVLYAMLASLAAFLIHNLIEFSLFEPGPMFLFALIAGSALGMRRQKHATTRPKAAAFLIAAAAVWLAVAFFLVLPIARAQALADLGDQEMRAGRFPMAHSDYLQASDWCGYNGDYPYRAAIAEAWRPGSDSSVVRDLLEAAIQTDPSAVRYYLSLAQLQTQLGDKDAARGAYDTALALNPNEVSIHLDYAESLMHLGLPAQAAAQCRLARKFNDLLPPDEPKRIDDSIIEARLAAALTQKNP
jgi:tetratricopeptide (TPR) repeat protein